MTKATTTALWAVLIMLPEAARSTEFFVDPLGGDRNNDGSIFSPWRSIQEVFDRGLVESQQWEKLPYKRGVTLVPKNPGAPVKAGDTILLLSGYHGELLIKNAYNSAPITVAAAEGHTPKLRRIRIRSGAG